MATDYAVDGSRIGEDGVGAVSWSGICEALISNWNEGNKLIIAITATSGSHTPGTESFKIRWRISGGSFADISNVGALVNGISDGSLNNGDPVGAACGCQGAAIGDSEECENENPHQTTSLSAGTKNDSVEVQSCIDMSGAVYEATYEFELYSVTESGTCGIATATVTIRADPVAANYSGKGIGRGIGRGIIR